MNPLVIYHANCADGFTAAWLAHRFYDGKVDFHPGVYQEPPPPVDGRRVLLLDFSYKTSILREMAQRAEAILILDHHKSAQEDLANIPTPDNNAGTISAIFDMERSGAQITWDYFWGNTPRPKLVDYTADRDLWQFKFPNSREVNAYIFSRDYTFANWDYLEVVLELNFNGVVEMGGAIAIKHDKDIRELLKVVTRPMVIGGLRMPVANLPYTMGSDAGNVLASSSELGVAGYYYDTPTHRVFGLRSTPTGPDVSIIASSYGGGGHAHAAGFRRAPGWEGDV